MENQFEAGTCKHDNYGEPNYSLSMEIKDHHIDFSAYSYPSKPGYSSRFVIFEMQKADMLELAKAIVKAANKIE